MQELGPPPRRERVGPGLRLSDQTDVSGVSQHLNRGTRGTQVTDVPSGKGFPEIGHLVHAWCVCRPQETRVRPCVRDSRAGCLVGCFPEPKRKGGLPTSEPGLRGSASRVLLCSGVLRGLVLGLSPSLSGVPSCRGSRSFPLSLPGPRGEGSYCVYRSPGLYQYSGEEMPTPPDPTPHRSQG